MREISAWTNDQIGAYFLPLPQQVVEQLDTTV